MSEYRPSPRPRPNPRLHCPRSSRESWLDRVFQWLPAVVFAVWGLAITFWIWSRTCGMGASC